MISIIPTSASSKIDRSSDWVVTEMANFRLISGISNVGDSYKVPLGLEFELKDDWKIYWRNPGDAGYPPEIDFVNNENLSELKLFWPAPKRFVFEDMQNFGYEKKIIFPITAILKVPGKPLVLQGFGLKGRETGGMCREGWKIIGFVKNSITANFAISLF